MEDFKNKIIIKKSYIEENNGLYRMNTPIIENGKEYNVYVEVEKEYADYLTTERADAQVYLTLPVAVREGYDIYSETPVTEMFLHNLNEILVPHLALGDSRIHKIKIYAETDNIPIGGNGVGTGISCGVDSLFTLKEYTNGKYFDMQLTHLFIASINMELMDTRHADLYAWEEQHKEEFDRFEAVCKETNLPLVKMYTNYFFYLCGNEFSRDWKYYHHLFTHHYITMAAVLALKKLWKIYYFSSSYDFTTFSLKNNLTNDPAHYEALLMHVLGAPDFLCFSGSACYNRFEKTISLADYNIAQMALHPCHKKGKMNCSQPDCDKCLRALATYDIIDKLDNFKNVFDVDKYKRDRSLYLYNIVKFYNDRFSTAFYQEIYQRMKEKYPDEMKFAEERYLWDSSPTVQKWQYDIVNKTYQLVLSLLTTENPAQALVDFFKSKNAKSVYLCGAPKLTGTIEKLLQDYCEEVQVYNWHNRQAKDCDLCFIGAPAKTTIRQKQIELINAGVKSVNIVTYFDLEQYLKTYNHD